MSFASYSEDILKRHESDVHDLMRELELGHVPKAQQTHVLPQFKALVSDLRKLLLDPSSPSAIRLIELRQQERRLALENEQLKAKLKKLGETNTELNTRVSWAKKDQERTKQELDSVRKQCKVKDERISSLEGELNNRDSDLAGLRRQIRDLERIALEAQVDRRA